MSIGFHVRPNAPLQARNTLRVAASAACLIEIEQLDALPQVFAEGWADHSSIALGSGSNMLIIGDPPSVLRLLCNAIDIIDDDGQCVLVRAQAGVDWHAFVLWTLQHGLSGLENLALIPGTVGASPIQNIGAYGVEVAECIHAVQAWHRADRAWMRLSRQDCGFAYRDSVFKRHIDAWIVTAVEFRLSRVFEPRLDYAGLTDELHAAGINEPNAQDVANAVMRIRTRKLPDPARIGNAGSFFKNPLVPAPQADMLSRAYPHLPVFPAGDPTFRKLSAAWLIEQCGWKGARQGDAGMSAQHALVLVNHHAASGTQLLAFARQVAASVQERFGIAIEPEPRIVGAMW